MTTHTEIDYSRPALARKRVAVCKDVIAQLDIEMYRTGPYGYLNIPERLPLQKDLQVYFGGGKTRAGKQRKQTKSCGVCAKGALFVSYVRKYDGVKAGDIDPSGDLCKATSYEVCAPLNAIFSQSQLNLIERVYEQWEYHVSYALHNRTERLRAICQNIIDNKGTFVP